MSVNLETPAKQEHGSVCMHSPELAAVPLVGRKRAAEPRRGMPSGGVAVSLNAAIGEAVRSDHRETADAYGGELFRLGRYRVAICREGIQWLFQRQRPGFPDGGAAWDTLGYCATRAGLMRLHRAHIGPDAAAIAALPERIVRMRREEGSDGQR